MSKLRMSFVFSAGTQEEKRQSETEKIAESIEQNLSVKSPSFGLTSTHTHSEPVCVAQ